jgi:hypothetical protein
MTLPSFIVSSAFTITCSTNQVKSSRGSGTRASPCGAPPCHKVELTLNPQSNHSPSRTLPRATPPPVPRFAFDLAFRDPSRSGFLCRETFFGFECRVQGSRAPTPPCPAFRIQSHPDLKRGTSPIRKRPPPYDPRHRPTAGS